MAILLSLVSGCNNKLPQVAILLSLVSGCNKRLPQVVILLSLVSGCNNKLPQVVILLSLVSGCNNWLPLLLCLTLSVDNGVRGGVGKGGWEYLFHSSTILHLPKCCHTMHGNSALVLYS